MAKVAGSLWVEGNDLHYVDQFNREWKIYGNFNRAQTGRPGSIWVQDQTLFYINEAGTAIYYPPPYGDLVSPINARQGSLWVAENNCLTWMGLPWTGDPVNYRLKVRAHTDIAAVSGHTDQHYDTPHSDSPAVSVPHTDIPSTATHIDEHADSPHYDFSDYYHGDFADAPQSFNDFSDQGYYYHPEYVTTPPFNKLHGDYYSAGHTFHEDYIYNEGQGPGKGSQHVDQWNHLDTPHSDNAHQDFHNDRPHVDESPEYGHDDHSDATPHYDVPHTDIPHTDGHVDGHDDAHVDSPHNDNPVLIGP